MILGTRKEHHCRGWCGSVERLETGAAKQTAINNRLAQQGTELKRIVNTAAPDARTKGVEIFGMFAHQESLRFPVTVLLREIVTDGRSPVVPDQRGGAESNFVANLLDPPAHIH